MLKLNNQDKKLNLLVAYPYFSSTILERLADRDRSSYRLIIDSGAFSAHNSKKIIRFEDYCSFLDKVKFLKWDAAVQLDVVFNPEATKQNWIKHLERGDDVCPVFTRGDSWDHMESLLSEDRYVFVGGVQRGEGSKEFAKYCMERTVGKKIHYLAFVRPDWVNLYRPFSTDSSSWSSSGQFGTLLLYKGGGRMMTLTKQNFIKRPSDEVISYFDDLGFDETLVRLFSKEASWQSKNFTYDMSQPGPCLHMVATICSYIKYSIECQNMIGTRVYMAVGTAEHLKLFFYCYDFLSRKGKI